MILHKTLTMPNLDHILIFKTNICSESDRDLLQPILDNHQSILNWNVDLQDCDFVLRIESETLDHAEVIELLNTHGFECCELT